MRPQRLLFVAMARSSATSLIHHGHGSEVFPSSLLSRPNSTVRSSAPIPDNLGQSRPVRFLTTSPSTPNRRSRPQLLASPDRPSRNHPPVAARVEPATLAPAAPLWHSARSRHWPRPVRRSIPPPRIAHRRRNLCASANGTRFRTSHRKSLAAEPAGRRSTARSRTPSADQTATAGSRTKLVERVEPVPVLLEVRLRPRHSLQGGQQPGEVPIRRPALPGSSATSVLLCGMMLTRSTLVSTGRTELLLPR